MRSLRRSLVVLVLLGAAGVALASPAAAHAELVRTDPPAGATLDAAPAAISLYFGEGVEATLGAIRLYDANGNELEMGGARHPGGDGTIVRASTPEMGDGTYVVDWRVVSADGHPIHSAFTFDVGAATGGGDAKGLVARLVNQQGSVGLGVTFAVLRWAAFVAVALVIGGLVFAGLLWSGAPTSRRAGRDLAVVAGVGAVAELLVVAFQGAYAGGFGFGRVLSPSLWADVAGTRFGRAHLAGAVLLAAVVPLARSLGRRGAPLWRAAAALLILGLAASVTGAGHATTGRWLGVAVAADLLHVLAASVWVGGLVGLVAWALRDGDPLDAARAARRFSAVALVSVTVVALSGVVQGVRQVGRLGLLTSTTYGWLLVTKTAIVVVVVGVAWVSRTLVRELAGVGEAVEAEPDDADDADDADEPAAPPELLRSYLRRSVAVEVVGVVAVLVVTTLLTNAIPAREVRAAPFDQTIVGDGGFAQVTIDPARSGTTAIHVTVTKNDGSIPRLDALAVRLSLPARQLGPIEVPMEALGPNHFVNESATIPFAGEWKLEVAAREGFEELTFTARFTAS